MTPKMLDLMFDAFDEDKSGFLDFKELAVILAMDSSKDDKETMELIFKMFDENKDGKVDAKELKKVFTVSFEC